MRNMHETHTAGGPPCCFQKITFRKQHVHLFCTGQSKGIQEPNFSRISFRNRSSKQALRKSSVSRPRRRTKQRGTIGLLLSSRQHVQGVETPEASPRRDPRCGHGAQKDSVKFYQNAHRLRHLIRHCLQGVHPKGHPHQGQGRKLTAGFAVQWHTQRRKGRKSQRQGKIPRVPLVQQVIGPDTLLEDSLYALQQQVHKQRWQLTPNQEKKGTFEELEKTLSRVCQQRKHHRHDVLCLWREEAKQPNLSTEQEEQAQHSLFSFSDAAGDETFVKTEESQSSTTAIREGQRP